MVDGCVKDFEIVWDHDKVEGTLKLEFHKYLLEHYHNWNELLLDEVIDFLDRSEDENLLVG